MKKLRNLEKLLSGSHETTNDGGEQKDWISAGKAWSLQKRIKKKQDQTIRASVTLNNTLDAAYVRIL